MEEKISVAVRVRPLNEREQSFHPVPGWLVDSNSNELVQLDERGVPQDKKYAYNHIFSETTPTSMVYSTVAKNIVVSAVGGMNGTIFAYGQTSSGKTYTMRGVIPMVVHELFQTIPRVCAEQDREFMLKVSYLEIYNEVIRDLLTPGSEDLKIYNNMQGNSYVHRLTSPVVNSYKNVLSHFRKGEENRHVAGTDMNEQSSRSHTIFQIHIDSRMKNSEDKGIRSSTLNLVDLAGSERVRDTQAEGLRLREGRHINLSLLTLERVIKTLSDNPKSIPHVPYRDSKLTRILQPALGGNSRTVIICAVTPGRQHTGQTESTLAFANRAKNIKNVVRVNEIVDDQTMILRLEKKVGELEKEIAGLKSGSKSSENKEQLSESQFQVAKLRTALGDKDKEISTLKHQLQQLSRQKLQGSGPPATSGTSSSSSPRPQSTSCSGAAPAAEAKSFGDNADEAAPMTLVPSSSSAAGRKGTKRGRRGTFAVGDKLDADDSRSSKKSRSGAQQRQPAPPDWRASLDLSRERECGVDLGDPTSLAAHPQSMLYNLEVRKNEQLHKKCDEQQKEITKLRRVTVQLRHSSSTTQLHSKNSEKERLAKRGAAIANQEKNVAEKKLARVEKLHETLKSKHDKTEAQLKAATHAKQQAESNLVRTRAELERIRKQIESMTKENDKLKSSKTQTVNLKRELDVTGKRLDDVLTKYEKELQAHSITKSENEGNVNLVNESTQLTQQLQTELDAVRGEKSESDDKAAEVGERLRVMETQLEEEEKASRRLEAELVEKTDRVDELATSLDALTSEKSQLELQVKLLNDDKTADYTRADQLSRDLEQTRADLERSRVELVSLSEQREHAQAEHQRNEAELNEKIQTLTAEHNDLSSERNDLSSALAKKTSELEALRATLAQTEAKLETSQKSGSDATEALNERILSLESELEKARTEASDAEDESALLTAEIESLQQTIVELEAKQKSLGDDLEQQQARSCADGAVKPRS